MTRTWPLEQGGVPERTGPRKGLLLTISALCQPKPDNRLDFRQAPLYRLIVIRSFRSKPLRVFFETDDGSKLPVQNIARVRRQLNALDAAQAPEHMAFPGWRFHPLKGKPKRYALDASGNYRITFGFQEEDAIEVDLEDYH